MTSGPPSLCPRSGGSGGRRRSSTWPTSWRSAAGDRHGQRPERWPASADGGDAAAEAQRADDVVERGGGLKEVVGEEEERGIDAAREGATLHGGRDELHIRPARVLDPASRPVEHALALVYADHSPSRPDSLDQLGEGGARAAADVEHGLARPQPDASDGVAADPLLDAAEARQVAVVGGRVAVVTTARLEGVGSWHLPHHNPEPRARSAVPALVTADQESVTALVDWHQPGGHFLGDLSAARKRRLIEEVPVG